MNTVRAMWASAILLVVSGVEAATYTSAKYRFSITPPAGWQQGNLPGYAADYFFAPKNDGKFRPNFNILEPLDNEGIAPAELCRLNARGIKEVLTNAREIKPTFDRASQICTITYRARPSDADLMFYAELRFTKSRFYALTFTAPETSFRKLLPSVQAAFKTFKPR